MNKIICTLLSLALVPLAKSQAVTHVQIAANIVAATGAVKEANMFAGDIALADKPVTIIIGKSVTRINAAAPSSPIYKSAQVARLHIINNNNYTYAITLPPNKIFSPGNSQSLSIISFTLNTCAASNTDENIEIGATLLLQLPQVKNGDSIGTTFPVIINYN